MPCIYLFKRLKTIALAKHLYHKIIIKAIKTEVKKTYYISKDKLNQFGVNLHNVKRNFTKIYIFVHFLGLYSKKKNETTRQNVIHYCDLKCT